METRTNTTAGVLFWTPALVRTSPTSSVLSEDVWEDEDEDEEQAEKDDDFVRQMDENGIIGLSEALQDVELGESCGDADSECSPHLYPAAQAPEEADSSGHERVTSPEELSYNRSDPLPHTNHQLPHSGDDWMAVGEEVGQKKEGRLPLRDKYMDMTEEEGEGECAGERSNRERKKKEHMSTSRERGTTDGSASKRELEIGSARSGRTHLLTKEAAGVSSRHCPVSQHAPASPYLLHFTAEELAAARGIEAETFPEMSITESPPGSHRSHISLKSSAGCSEVKLRASLQPAAMCCEGDTANLHSGVSNGPLKGSVRSDKHHKQPAPSPRKTRQRSPEATYSRACSPSTARPSLQFQHRTASTGREARTPRASCHAAEVDGSRKGPLSYPTPDFSKVEPRVQFPKGGYTPPKSRRSSKRESLSPEPPLVFKSPADIVKEVLLNATDESPAPADSHRPRTGTTNSTVPLEFRSRRQATTLLEQLQEDYNRLLTKYAEAENTIDRLRLEAKVNLYSDLPKPGLSVQRGLNQPASKIITLDYLQAQRAEMNSASPRPDGHNTHQRSPSACPSTRSPGPQVGQQLARILYSQADKFLQQLQTFEEILKSKRLNPFEQTKGLRHLAEGLDALERGYLLARDEHKLLQQRGAEISQFDPERELEGLIFQCVLHMDELKEQAEQMQQEQPICEAPPHHPTPSSVPSEGGESLTPPQSPPEPLLVGPGEAAVEVSSASEESDGEVVETETEKEEEETLNSQYLRHVEQDFANLMDHYQSFKELPKLSDQSQREGAPLPGGPRPAMQPGNEERERRGEGSGNPEVQKSPPQSKSDHVDSALVGTDRSTPPSRRASSRSTTLHGHPPSSRRRLEVGKSHSSSLSSLGDITAPETRKSKLGTGISRVLSQDGIISPETDSGFVGSESSRVTPAAAAPSPLHQRASESVSVAQEWNPGKPHTDPVSAPCPASPPSHSRTAAEASGGSRLSSDRPRRSRQGQRRRTFSCSPQRRVSRMEHTRADSGTSEFGLESDSTHTVSEDGQNDPYTQTIHSPHSSRPSSSPAVRYHHGDSSRTLSHGAIQTLQAEVTRLRERVESCLRTKKPPSSVRAAPSAQENHTPQNTSPPSVRSGERLSDVSRGKRDGQTVEEFTLRRTTRKRPPSTNRQKPQHDVWQHPAAPADEPDSRSSQAHLCPLCFSRRRGRPEGQVGGNGELPHSSHHCHLCGCPEPCRGPEPDCRRVSDTTSCQPAGCPDGAVRARYFAAAAPPALLQCIPVCPPSLLLYPSPLYASPSNSTGTSSGVRGREEVKGRIRRSLSADKQRSVDSSLNRAIRAARHMRHTSGHMARSLAAGLQYQELLTQSCSY